MKPFTPLHPGGKMFTQNQSSQKINFSGLKLSQVWEYNQTFVLSDDEFGDYYFYSVALFL